MKGSELELWIALLATWNFITVQSNGWMLIFDNYWKVDLWEADTWQGPKGICIIDVSL